MANRIRLRAAGLEWRTIDEEVVALDLPRESYLGVNRAGSKLWAALAEGTTEEELVQALVDEYGLDRAAAERDVAQFLSELREQGLLESA